MGKVIFNAETLKLMSLFERFTKSKLKDCIITDNLVIFVVKEGYASKAIGKNGANVKALQNKLNRKIKIVEFNSNLSQFVENLLLPLKLEEVYEDNKIVFVKSKDFNIKSVLIGRKGSNLRKTETLVRRYFPDLKEIKVI